VTTASEELEALLHKVYLHDVHPDQAKVTIARFIVELTQAAVARATASVSTPLVKDEASTLDNGGAKESVLSHLTCDRLYGPCRCGKFHRDEGESVRKALARQGSSEPSVGPRCIPGAACHIQCTGCGAPIGRTCEEHAAMARTKEPMAGAPERFERAKATWKEVTGEDVSHLQCPNEAQVHEPACQSKRADYVHEPYDCNCGPNAKPSPDAPINIVQGAARWLTSFADQLSEHAYQELASVLGDHAPPPYPRTDSPLVDEVDKTIEALIREGSDSGVVLARRKREALEWALQLSKPMPAMMYADNLKLVDAIRGALSMTEAKDATDRISQNGIGARNRLDWIRDTLTEALDAVPPMWKAQRTEPARSAFAETPKRRIEVEPTHLGYLIHLRDVWGAAAHVNADEARALTDALIAAQGSETALAAMCESCETRPASKWCNGCIVEDHQAAELQKECCDAVSMASDASWNTAIEKAAEVARSLTCHSGDQRQFRDDVRAHILALKVVPTGGEGTC
jgi:hypothetical protein